MPHLVVSLPSTGHPADWPHRPWFARQHPAVLVDQRCCLRICNMTLFRQFTVEVGQLASKHVWERGQLARSVSRSTSCTRLSYLRQQNI